MDRQSSQPVGFVGTTTSACGQTADAGGGLALRGRAGGPRPTGQAGAIPPACTARSTPGMKLGGRSCPGGWSASGRARRRSPPGGPPSRASARRGCGCHRARRRLEPRQRPPASSGRPPTRRTRGSDPLGRAAAVPGRRVGLGVVVELDDLGRLEERRGELGTAHHQHGRDREVAAPRRSSVPSASPNSWANVVEVLVRQPARADHGVDAVHRQPQHGPPRRVGDGRSRRRPRRRRRRTPSARRRSPRPRRSARRAYGSTAATSSSSGSRATAAHTPGPSARRTAHSNADHGAISHTTLGSVRPRTGVRSSPERQGQEYCGPTRR